MQKIYIERSVFWLTAVLLLFVPLKWLFAMALAAMVHELGHILAVGILGGEISSIRVGTGEACIEASIDSIRRAAVCTLAGPAANILLLLFYRWLPRTAICSAIQFLYNMLPIYPLDGGRLLQMAVNKQSVQRYVESFAVFALALLGIWLTKILGIETLPVCFFLLLLLMLRKIPCKEREQIVQ